MIPPGTSLEMLGLCTRDEVAAFIKRYLIAAVTSKNVGHALSNVLRIGVARRVETSGRRRKEPPHNSVLN